MEKSPPDSWYDPPELKHSDGTRIRPECNCLKCHAYHIQAGLVEEQVQYASQDYKCCVDELEQALDLGIICKTHMAWLGRLQNGQWWCDQCGEADSNYNGHPNPNGR